MSKNRKRNGRKPGNQRSGRRRTGDRRKLNVRVSSKRASRARWGLLSRRGVKYGAAALLVFGLAMGIWRAADHLLFESPKFRLSVIDYKTDGYLSKSRVLEEGGVGSQGDVRFPCGVANRVEELVESRVHCVSAFPSVGRWSYSRFDN